MSSISAGTSSGTALVQSGDTTGALVIKTGGSAATAATFNADQTVTLAAPLPVASGGTGATSLSGITVGTATSATTATNLSGGSGGTIPYQTSSGATSMLAAGTNGYLLQSNGAAAPSWVAPVAAAGTVTAIASGSLSNGSAVIVNSDGTVSVVSQTVLTTPSFGSAVNFDSDAVSACSACYNPSSNRVFIAYSDDGNGSYGTCVVGTVSGNSITFGTPVVFRAGYCLYINIISIENTGYVAVAWRDNGLGGVGRLVFGSWAGGNSVSFANYYTFESSSTFNMYMAYAPGDQSLAIFYSYGGNIAGAVTTTFYSGGSVSGFGSRVNFPTGSSVPVNGICVAYDPTQGYMALFYRNQNNNYGYGVSVLANGPANTASFGTPVTYSTNLGSGYSSCVYTTSSKTALVYVDGSNNNYLTGVVATLSGNTISFGTAVQVGAVTISYPSITYDTAFQRLFVFYQRNGGVSNASASVGSISGTSLNWGAVTQMLSQQIVLTSACYDSTNGKVVVAYGDAGASPQFMGRSIISTVGTSTNLTSENFIGFSDAAYANGATATIQTVGSVDDAQSSLTPGQSYYVQQTGTIGLTADTPSVFAGTAVAATKIIVKG